MTIFAANTDRYVEQDVLARLDYAECWESFMAQAPDDVIISSDWVAQPDGLTLSDKMHEGDTTAVFASGGTPGTIYRISNTIQTQQGRRDVRYFFLMVKDGGGSFGQTQTALFNRFTAIQQFKTSSIAFTSGSFPIEGIRDDDIWSNLVQAEADVSHQLRVLLAPTVIVPEHAPQFEIDQLVTAGTAYRTEGAYDYDPATWTRDAWGFIKLKSSPVIRLDSMRFAYPGAGNTVLDVPADWCQLDKKYGHLTIVPSGTLMGMGPLSSYMMMAISGGRIIPGMIQLRYVAGLENAARDYPDLIGLVQRMAVLKILKGGFLPQSGSISADGLSQSSSIDTGKWQDEIEADLEHLRQSIHGIRLGVF